MKYLRRLFWIFFKYLPTPIRHNLLRNLIRLPIEVPDVLQFKIVETKEELEKSFRLVYQAYITLGYCSENADQMRATIYHALPTTSTLIAIYNGLVVGTLTIVRDNRLSLPSEKVFDFRSLRKQGARVAEITSLAVHPDYRRKNGGKILFPLLKLMYEYSTQFFGVNHLVVTIHPKEIDFYKAILLFQDIPGCLEVKNYMDAPAVCLQLDLHQAYDRYRKVFASKQKDRNLFNFFVETKMENILLPSRKFHKINDPVVDFKYYQKFFMERLKVTRHSPGWLNNQKDMRRVEEYFKREVQSRFHPRSEVDISVKVEVEGSGVSQDAVLKDVSRMGFHFFSDIHLTQGVGISLSIEVAPTIVAQISARVIWKSNDGGVGCLVTNADQTWKEYIDFLYEDQNLKNAA